MANIPSSQLLRVALWTDAIVSGGFGLIQVLATQSVYQLTGLATPLLTGTGWFMLAYGVLLSLLARHPHPSTGFVWVLVLGNPAWGLASAVLLSQIQSSLTPAGKAYLVVMVLWGFGIAMMQYMGLQLREGKGA